MGLINFGLEIGAKINIMLNVNYLNFVRLSRLHRGRKVPTKWNGKLLQRERTVTRVNRARHHSKLNYYRVLEVSPNIWQINANQEFL